MANKGKTVMDITEIIRRWQSGQSIRAIKRETGYDRATIGKYISIAEKKGLKKDVKLTSEEIKDLLSGEITPAIKSEKTDILLKYADEFKKLITDKENPLKPKSAFEVLSERHEFQSRVSYTTFKRFARTYGISKDSKTSTCRIDVPIGSQIQVDYAKVGYLFDPVAKKRRTLYAFIGTLGYSRHKFVEYTFSQNQQSFTESHVRMFNSFGGLTETIRIDNLKSGVIKPDLYDPQLNRSYREMAEYYGIFIDSCRVATPKDKPIVERDVQTIREEFRKSLARNPSITLYELNKEILSWIINVYGQRLHGTTQLKPYEEFTLVEKPSLRPLPIDTFQPATWKEAKVHPDHYIQVNKKSYSMPHEYVGKRLWVKVTGKMIYAYYNDQMIKQHLIPSGTRQTDLNDFPENMKHAMDSGLPMYLRKKALEISPEFGELINKILSPHAYINMRKAQSIMSIAEKHPKDLITRASTSAMNDFRHINPTLFKSIIEKLEDKENETTITISEATQGLLRDMEYFMN
jgi:transposase